MRLVKKLKFGKNGKVLAIEIYDAQQAAVHLGRKYKMFTDKVETETPDVREQVDKVATLVQELVDKFSISNERAREIVNDVFSDSDLGDPDLATNSVS